MRKANDEVTQGITKQKEAGELIVLNAAAEASAQMERLTANSLRTKGQKTAALQRHALYMGIGTMFMGEVAPIADTMQEELEALHREHDSEISSSEARILVGFWLAKIFIEIQKGIKKYEQES